MKTKVVLSRLVLSLLALSAHPSSAGVNITEPTGGQNISADKALNSTNGAAFTALGSIIIAEGANTDFAAGNNQTLILSPPYGWRFNAGVGTVTFQGSRDLTAASILVTASNLTVTFSAAATAKGDTLTIAGLQVQPLEGQNAPLAGYIVQSAGTASIAGIIPESTSFGLCNTLPGTARALAMHTQPPATAVVGVLFDPQPEVKVLDQFGNLREMDVTTVVTASRAAGSGTLQGAPTEVAIAGVVTYTNLSHNVLGTMSIQFTSSGLTPVTSGSVVVMPAPATRLVFSTQPGSASVGNPFGIQPVVKSQDQFGNNTAAGLPGSKLVSIALSGGTGPLLGTTTIDIGTNAGNGVATFTNLQLDAAGANKQLTATTSGFSNGVSSVFSVSAASFSKLQILVPGETAAPGTPSGKTGSPSAQSSGAAFNVTVNAVDANWNLVNTISDLVGITSSDSLATLPSSAALVNGTKVFNVTLNTVGSSSVTASDLGQPSKTPNTSSAITVGGGSPRKLKLQTQPSSSAIAGVAFGQQPVVRVEDAGGNLVTVDNGRVITATRATGTGALQGTVTAVTVNGLATFSNLAYNQAETITINFTASSLTNVVSDNIAVSATTVSRLAFATQPGGASRSGSLLVNQPVIVTQDQFGNPSTSGLPANLSLTLTLTSGSGALLGTTAYDIGAGLGTVSCSDLICSAPGGNKQLTATAAGLSNAVSAPFVIGGLITASGGSAISADTIGGSYTSLSGPAYYEAVNADASVGTIILSPPAGFIFDTAGVAPAVIITRLGGSGGNLNNVNGLASGVAAAITSRTTNQITFTITSASSGGVACSLTWTNVRVRPLAGTPLASGNLTKSGSSVMATVTAGVTSFGALTEVPGTANRLAFTTQPGAAIAGSVFGLQPVIHSRDQFGNNSVLGLPASKIVTLALSSGTGPLLGTSSLDIGTAAGNGVATFTDLEIDAALTTKQLTASASGFTNAVSSIFAVSPGPANRLTIQVQPSSSVTAGASLAQQPVIRIEDQFGNLRTLDSGTVITASRNAGSGILQGSTNVASAGGVVSFANLAHNVAGTMTISFTSPGLTGATSTAIEVNPAAANRLTIQTQPSTTATAGTAFAQQPVVRIEDQYGNLRSSDNSTVTAARSAGSGALQGATSIAAVAGVASFTNLSHNVPTNISILFSSGALLSATSGTIAVSPAVADRLVFVAQPGSGTAGSALTLQPVLKTRDPLGNDSTVGLPAHLNVTLGLTSGSGVLQGTATLDIGTAAGNGQISFSDLRIDSTGTNKQLTATASGLTSAVSSFFSINPGAAHHLTLQAQPSATATAGVSFAQQPVLRVEDSFGNLRTTDSGTMVSAARGLGSGTLQGTTSGTASAGLVSFGNLSYTVAEIINLNFTSPGLVSIGSSNISVSVGAATKLTMVTQPSSSATAGVPFGQQPQVRIEDTYGNLRSSDNSTVVSVARGSGTGTLQGATTATVSGGVASFGTLSYPVAETITLVLSSGGLSSVTSSNIVVSAGPFTKLQVLAPGETAAPGTPAGKLGQPLVQLADVPFNVTVNAVDTNWNLVNSISDLVEINSSDPNAVLPADAALVAGSQQFSISLSTGGTNTVAAVDLTDGSKAPGLSSGIPVNARHTAAVGGGAISADTVGGTFTSLTGPTYAESVSGEAGLGTIILKTPAGFVFDTTGTSPTVRIDRLGGSGINSRNINGVASGSSVSMTSVSATQVVFTVTGVSSSGVTCKLTWQNLRVRPTAGTPLAINKITKSGTSVLAGIVNGVSNFGLLREVAGAAARLAVQTAPSSTATAGEAFGQQPMIAIQDQFGNMRNAANGAADNSTVVSAARAAGSGTLQGSTTATAANGLAAFVNLSHTVATNITVLFTSGVLSNATSPTITIGPATADRLVFATQPANGVAGGPLATQPVVRSRDAYGNNSAVGLAASKLVTLTLSAGTGSLVGTTTFDIGTNHGNGSAGFTDVGVSAVGEGNQLTASAGGLLSAVSSSFAVSGAFQTITFGALADKTYGQAPITLNATASSGLPVSYSIVSGPGTLLGNTLTMVGAGPITVRAMQTGDSSWSPAAPVDRSFTVTKAALTVVANDAARAYGQMNPPLTGSVVGLQAGDTITASCNTSAQTNSPVGSYVIASSLNDPQGKLTNYTLFVTNGTLTIAPAALSVTANDVTRTYGQANPAFSGTLAGVQNGDAISALYSSVATVASPVGDYAIVPTLNDPNGKLTNYAVFITNGTLEVTAAELEVTANDSSRVYGQANPSLSGTVSGIQNGDNITAQFSSTATANSPAGTYAIVPNLSDPQGKLGNYNLSANEGTLTITKALLTVTANNNSRVYGAPEPAFTATIAGFVDGETLATSGLTGNPSFSTTAALTSSIAGGPYAITPAAGTLNSGNYDFSFVAGLLTVTPASSLTTLTPSANPSPTGSNVTFTAALSAIAPSSIVPSGTVQFSVDGLALGAPVALSNGLASVSTAALSHGSHLVRALFAGDANLLGSTNELVHLVNSVPLAGPAQFLRTNNTWIKISISELIGTYTSDADGDLRTLVSVGNGTNDASVIVVGDWIYYLPSEVAPNRNTTDHLQYTVTDGFAGGEASGVIKVEVTDPNAPTVPCTVTGIAGVTNGFRITFSGQPNFSYQIQRTSVLGAPSSWQNVGSAATDGSGQGEFIDTNPAGTQGYYRITRP